MESRRNFTKKLGSIALGSSLLVNSSSLVTATVGNSGVEFTFQTPTQEPLSNADTYVHNSQDYSLIEGPKTTNSSGSVTLNQGSYSNVIVSVRGSSDRPWFDSFSFSSLDQSNVTDDVTVFSQYLYEPKIPYVDKSKDYMPLGAVSVWREVITSVRQDIYFSITNTNVGAGDAYDLTTPHNLDGGGFNITFPESVATVDYGESTPENWGGAQIYSLPTLPTPSGVPQEKMHPKNPNSPSIPLFLTAKEHFVVNGPNSSVEDAEDVVGEAYGAIPFVGTALTITNVFNKVFDNPFEKRATLPKDIPTRSDIDPNTYDTIQMPWRSGGESAVVLHVPLKFNDPRGGEFIFTTEWKKASNVPLSFPASSGGFYYSTQIRPLGAQPIVDDTAPTDVDSDGLYEDIDGDGQLTQSDAELLAANIDNPAVTQNTELYDFNNNGRIDYDDAVELSNEADQ